MDNLPKEENQNQEPQKEGEVFSGPAQSPYSEATQVENTASPPGEIYSQEGGVYGSEPAVSESAGQPPPPFVEDKKRKLVFLLIGILFLLLFIFLGVNLFQFLAKRGSKNPSSNQKVTLKYWGLWEEEEVFRPVIDDYQRQHPNITIEYVRQDPKQYRERLQAAIERGEGPDIYRFHNTWLPMMVKYLSSMPKTVYSDEEFGRIFYPVIVNDLKMGGNFYGVPLQIDGLVLFYNEDIFKSANVPVPQTWVDVQNILSKLTVKEKGKIVTSAIALGTAENVEHFSDVLSLMMLQNGTQMAKSLFSCTAGGSMCAVEALSFYRKFSEAPQEVWNETLENSILAFAGGKVAMILAPSWQALTIRSLSEKLNFKIAPVPQLPCAKEPCPQVHWASYWVEGVSAKSVSSSAAWEFLKYLSSAETLQKLYAEEIKYRKLFGEAYPRIEMGKLLTDNPYLSPLIESASSMKSFYTASRTSDGETGLNSSLNTYLKDAVNSLSQGVSPETAMKTVDNGFKQVFTRFGISTPP